MRAAGAGVGRVAAVVVLVVTLAGCQTPPRAGSIETEPVTTGPAETGSVSPSGSGSAAADERSASAASSTPAATVAAPGTPYSTEVADDLTPDERAWLDELVAHAPVPEDPAAEAAFWAREPALRAAADAALRRAIAHHSAEAGAEDVSDPPTCAPGSWEAEVAAGRMSFDRYTVLAIAMLRDLSHLPQGGAELCSGGWPLNEQMGIAGFLFIDATSPRVKVAVAATLGEMTPGQTWEGSTIEQYQQDQQ